MGREDLTRLGIVESSLDQAKDVSFLSLLLLGTFPELLLKPLFTSPVDLLYRRRVRLCTDLVMQTRLTLHNYLPNNVRKCLSPCICMNDAVSYYT